MSPLLYHALWIATALGGIAIASALIARHLQLRAIRREQAELALEGLARYCEWLAAQRRNASFDGDRPPGRPPLMDVLRAQQVAFPEVANGVAALLALHARILDFLWRQQMLRQRDPEAWLDSDHDQRFMELWNEHREAVHGLADHLRTISGEPLADAQPESVYP